MEECVFCKIVQGEIPAKIIYESEHVIAFRDINPQAPVHILVIPKEHINPKGEVKSEEAEVLKDIFLACKEVAKKEGVGESGFRLIANVGDDAGQEIDHLHFHLLGGKKLGPMVARE